MEIAMKESALQYKIPKVEYISFERNEDYNEKNELDMQMTSAIEIDKNDENREATITLALELGEEGTNAPFFLKIAANSDFRWEESVNFDIDKTLKLSGSTMLLSYLRPIVANVTMQAGLPPFQLPFLDLTGQ